MLLPVLLCPLVGMVVLFFTQKASKAIGLAFSFLTFLLSLFLWIGFDSSNPGFQYGELTWIGLDGISLFFILLTTILTPLSLLASWSIDKSPKEFFLAFLGLEACMLLVFSLVDLLLFYIFFESVLIPMFFIIGIWGSRQRKIRAAFQFFLYTLVGSLLMFLALLLLYFESGSTDYETLLSLDLSERRQYLLWFAFFCSFAVKVPMIPVHLWLPEAHVEAPTAGSVILAGVLLKLGTYGFLRFSLPLFPMASFYFAPFVYLLSLLGIVYASLTTLRQVDLKKVIAYSSVAHMGYVTLGIFSLNLEGVEGALVLMLSHGVVSGGLFLCIGFLYDRYKTRLIPYYGGLVHGMPLFALVFLLLTLGNLGCPGTSSFIGEFLVLHGCFQTNPFATLLAGTGMILGAAYSLWLYNRVVFGHMKPFYFENVSDLNRREWWTLLPLLFLVIWIGVYPAPFLDPLHCSTQNLLTSVYVGLKS